MTTIRAVDKVTYLIVGGGMTADAAAKGIREQDPEGSIALVGSENHAPYKRPPLTKGLWKGDDEAKIWKHTEDAGVELRLGRTIAALDLEKRVATDDRGDGHPYEKLLLATGGSPRRLGGDNAPVVYYRTLDDYHAVRKIADEGARFTVIGGGFIGSEIAAALASNGCKVAMVFPEHGIGARLFPKELSLFVNDYYRAQGVDVHDSEMVASVSGTTVTTESGKTFEADAVIAGLGIVPNVALAEAHGLEVDNGVVVDEYGCVEGRGDVFAAGDVANFPMLALGIRTRVEHEDHANTHGKYVGANMAGAKTPYDHLPLFYSDMFDLGYEAVGVVDSRLDTVQQWAEPNKKGVVAYVDDDRRPHGYLLWNTWDKVDAAREKIRAGEPVDESKPLV